ncbi:MAG: 3'(2'),5'-bisphosphate nucleotidase CysQ [Zunongwangia sp.]|uniref:3'(2'),5'-bisphosphate nucleotidase CysQ n=1 Tax=Zunongwangia sp. TaxID=1965325 RepID=UPI003242A0BE
MEELLKMAVEASLKAGGKIIEIYENDDFEVDFKGDDSPLTKADIASHNVIMDFLKETGIPVLSEEGRDIPYEERKNWEQLWIVDPIDGTKEFIKKNGEFTVNIALIENQKPVLGVIYVPALQNLYYASATQGSFKAENIGFDASLESISEASQKLPLKLTKDNYTVVASKSHLSKETEDYIVELKNKYGEVETISKGSSLKLCMVAEGVANCYPRFAPTMEWDTAAGQAICTFAGKEVIDYRTGKEMLYNRENLLNSWFIVH